MSPIIKLVVPEMLGAYTDGRVAFDIEGDTVAVCLKEIINRFPKLEPEVFNKDGNLLPRWLVVINDRVAYYDPLQQAVAEGDILKLIPVIAGG